MAASVVREVNIPRFPVRRGKVRDIYDLGDRLLLVATDRISAFDCILPDPIPHKGRVLTGLSGFWFERFADQCPNHFDRVIEGDPPPGMESAADQLRGRAMLCRKARVVPIECVARGYLAGSGWREYEQHGTVCGIRIPSGLQNASPLPDPIFTPATKALSGHDENISFEAACAVAGRDVMTRLRDLTLALYRRAAEYLLSRGIILADTKFEFGFAADAGDGDSPDALMLVDEVLTPDSSRFWPADLYEEGREQESFDKQFVRNYLQQLCDEGRWDKTDPAPRLPTEIIDATSDRYLEAYRRITRHLLGR